MSDIQNGLFIHSITFCNPFCLFEIQILSCIIKSRLCSYVEALLLEERLAKQIKKLNSCCKNI